MEIVQIPVLADNYNYLLHDPDTGETAVIDPSLPEPVLQAADERGWKISRIFNTHHHWDHTDGNLPVKEATGCMIYGYGPDAYRIRGIDVEVEEGEHVLLGKYWASVLFLPGHTHGHIAYHFEEQGVIFSGDVLFGCGCGRLFEGEPETMYNSLRVMAALPDDTIVYAAHEYTQHNIDFAMTVEPGNKALQERKTEVERLRRQNKPTIPTTIGLEKATNPFLRCFSPEIRGNLAIDDEIEDVEVFTKLRQKRDHF